MITEINNNLLYGWTLGWTPSTVGSYLCLLPPAFFLFLNKLPSRMRMTLTIATNSLLLCQNQCSIVSVVLSAIRRVRLGIPMGIPLAHTCAGVVAPADSTVEDDDAFPSGAATCATSVSRLELLRFKLLRHARKPCRFAAAPSFLATSAIDTGLKWPG